MIVSQHGCETLMCNVGAPLFVSQLPSAQDCVLCCWHDGLVAAYKRTQLFVLSVWSLQLPHRIAHMCIHHGQGIAIATTVGGQCSVISAADGLVLRTFSLGPIVVMSMFVLGESCLLVATRDGRIMMFSLGNSVVCKASMSIGCPLLDSHLSDACVLSVVKSNSCVQLIEFDPSAFLFRDGGSIVCLRTATMSVITGETHGKHYCPKLISLHQEMRV
jgi:hypothetical protein